MRIIATHPGRNGDILWSLPTVRALAQAYGEPIHLEIPAQYGTLAPLLAQQPYIASVLAREDWVVEQTAPITPRQPPTRARKATVYTLGYGGWPSPTLPEDVYDRVDRLMVHVDRELPALDLTTPWITAKPWIQVPHRIAIGFTDEHFELKYGIVQLLQKVDLQSTAFLLTAPGSRWEREADTEGVAWLEAARRIASAEVFFGCCSALHVLAVGLGIPVVCMEPNPHRLNSVFWPCGQDGPQVRLVRGNDGQATFDARACAEALRAALEERR